MEGVGAVEKVEVVREDALVAHRALGVHVQNEVVALELLELFSRGDRRLFALLEFALAVVEVLVVTGEGVLDELGLKGQVTSLYSSMSAFSSKSPMMSSIFMGHCLRVRRFWTLRLSVFFMWRAIFFQSFFCMDSLDGWEAHLMARSSSPCSRLVKTAYQLACLVCCLLGCSF